MPYKLIGKRKGNRLDSSLETRKTKELGWEPKNCLKEYLHDETKNY